MDLKSSAAATAGNVSTARRLASWVNGFSEFTAILPSPEIFRLWTAIGIISAALERRVWVRVQGMDLFANLYLILVGPPGSGKSVALSQAEKLLRLISDLFIAPSNVSSASLIDCLSDAKRRIVRPAAIPPFMEYHALTAIASELGVLMPAYEPSFMNLLQKIYDGELVEDRKRTRSVNVRIDKPILTILAGTTASYLNGFLPEGAWDQGFISRTVPIYCGDRTIVDPFREEIFDQQEALFASLLSDIRAISQLAGRMNFQDDAAAAISAWHRGGGKPAPEHSKLQHYLPRRTTHVLKLCMVSAVSEGRFVIEMEDFKCALKWLLEAEAYMPEIFKAMATSTDGAMMDETWDEVWKYWNKNRRAIPERLIIDFLGKRVPYHAVLRLLELMVRSGKLKASSVGMDGKTMYEPGPKYQDSF